MPVLDEGVAAAAAAVTIDLDKKKDDHHKHHHHHHHHRHHCLVDCYFNQTGINQKDTIDKAAALKVLAANTNAPTVFQPLISAGIDKCLAMGRFDIG